LKITDYYIFSIINVGPDDIGIPLNTNHQGEVG